MRKHTHEGHDGPPEPRARAPRHPLNLLLGLLLVAGLLGVTVFAGITLYRDYAWRATAQETASGVAQAVREFSEQDVSTPTPVDAVAGSPAPGQVGLDTLPYADDLPPDVARLRITAGGSLSVVTSSGALCSGLTLDMTDSDGSPKGAFQCGDAQSPPAPLAPAATPRDGSVTLEWAHPPVPVEEYLVSYSANDGATWVDVEDGVSAVSRVTVRELANGRTYLFRISAVNLVGESSATTTRATPFTSPGAPTGVGAIGGFSAVVTWTPPSDDGGRPLTGFVVTGDPTGTCLAAATATRCELADLPAAPGYTFTVRATNEAGASAPSATTPPVSVYSAPGRPVALDAAPGNQLALLTWTPPLQDGNTPITDYLVDYRVAGAADWIPVAHAASPETTRVVGGLVNGTAYEFQVRAVNAAGVSDPPLTLAATTPATVPGGVPSLTQVSGNESASLTWTAPATDGESPLTDYAIQFHAKGDPWQDYAHPEGTGLTADVTGLENGTTYAFRVAAVNAMGQGPWSPRALGRPVGPPGPVVEPESVGSLTAIELTWKPPENDGGRRLAGYRVEYKLSADLDWITLPRIPSDVTTATVEDLVAGEAYDFRIMALSRAGVGPATVDGSDRPTLAGVIADETPPAPKGFTAIPGDGTVILRWRASPAGKDSPITGYTVTGVPTGSCTTKRLTCVVRGLTNGTPITFTVSASNENITGPESKPVTATPKAFNDATGGEVSTYTRGGRTFRVHTFFTGGTFTVTAGALPFSVLVVAGGAGSSVGPDGAVVVGGGGAILEAGRVRLPDGALAVGVGAGGSPGSTGGASSLDGVGTAPGGSVTPDEFSPVTTSDISGTDVTYGGNGTPTSGPGADGRGTGGGGPEANRGGNGIVIISYEVAR